MPDYRRNFVPGGTYFFTVKTEHRVPIFHDAGYVRLLGDVFREMKQSWPCDLVAIVLLPDHLHTIWNLPPGDVAYPTRWAWLKKEFTKRYLNAGGKEAWRSASRRRNRRRGVWQRRFWEHTIEDEGDFDGHFDYVHWNPVKHGYVRRVADWPYSSFHRWVKLGVYTRDWGSDGIVPARVERVSEAGE